jgi:N-methylhydantoinase A
VAFESVDTLVEFDMAYVGQSHTIVVEAGADPASVTEAGIGAAFDRVYADKYGQTLPGLAKRIINLRVITIGRRPKFDLMVLAPQGDITVEGARLGNRPVWFGGRWHETAIYARLDLPVGAVIEGPAILEQPDTTILVEPDLTALVDPFGNIILSRRT